MVRKHPVFLKTKVVKILIAENQVQFFRLNEETEIHSFCVIVQVFRAGWAAPGATLLTGKGNGTPENPFLMFAVKDKVMGSFSLALCQW